MIRKLMWAAAATAVIASPLQAAAFDQSAVQHGAFVGARFQLSLGGKTPAQPRAGLAIAPTQSRISNEGMIRTKIGEGIALNVVAPGSKPTITLAGVRADKALGLTTQRSADPQNKAGISTGGWIAIGVGVAALAAGAYFVHLVREADENSD